MALLDSVKVVLLLAVILPVSILVTSYIFAALPSLSGQANTTVTQIMNNVWTAFALLGIGVIVVGAAAILHVVWRIFTAKIGGQP